ncbi:MAG: glycosyltransferase family 2 protein, partial [Rhizomicrobium sp.]
MNGSRANDQNVATAPIALSIVAPCYNEQDGLSEFVARMVKAAEAAAGEDYELILVNDGSRDNTWPCIRAITQTNPRILGVNLSRNHGHQLAVTAGLSLTRGENILIIDADLQDPPELLPEMTARLREGFDVVYGRRRTRAKESTFKLATASIFYKTLRMLSDVDIPADTGDFRLMSRRIVGRLNAMPEHDRFLRGMVAWLGGKQIEILYDRDPRFAGHTGYTLSKMLRLAANGVVGFSTRPLKLSVLFA